MSKWFPDVAEADGLEDARKAGFIGALAFAAMIALGVAFLLATGLTPDLQQSGLIVGALLGMAIELALVLVAAWRLKAGKGAFWGTAILVLFVVEIATKFMAGATNVGWLIAYAAIFMALLNGVRGAWARRNGTVQDAFD